uniref:Uncharacterized protein n=1 Tax=Chenopodium quinoa TaxID=63459 RepID=A0A803LW73_CHEQI
MIQQRMKVELKRGFGQGIVLDKLRINKENPVKKAEQEPSSSSAPEDIMAFLIDEFNNMAKALASHVNEMYALVDKAYKMLEEVEIPDEMKSLIKNVWGKYSSVQPTISQERIRIPGILSQDQNLFDEPAFLSELNDVMSRSWATFQPKIKGKNKKYPPEHAAQDPSHVQAAKEPPPQELVLEIVPIA